MKKRLVFISILMVLFLTIFSSCAPAPALFCKYCGGSGKCTKCEGRGKINGRPTGNFDLEGNMIYDYTDECNICIGTGYCSYCQGQGKVY